MKEISLKNEAWMTPKELEAQYGITEGAQYKLRMNKNYEDSACNCPIPFVRVGKRVLYYKSDIENWLLAQRKGVVNM